MNLKVGIKLFLIGVLLFLISPVFSQYATSGKIIFERRTNLEKRFTDKRMKRMINETNKIKTDKFVLLFNDTCSIFKLLPENTGADDMAWMTTKNTYYQQLQKKNQLTILGLFGQSIYVLDSLPSRQWKITDNKRVISGYDCRKAIYQKNDTTRIYAWYTSALIPSVGPEGFCGLPGTILGLATEDGGIIYFAKSVELISPKKEDLDLPIGKNKVFSMLELRLKIEKEYGNTPWGKGMFDDLFRWL